MNDYLIAEFVNSINEIVKQPIRLTQRIKYTSCDVSQQYIVFGASSGGLYVFNRHPCSFDKLIPSTEGSVIHVSISPDEKFFAIATSKGTVCLVEIDDKNVKDIQVYHEHVGNTVTAMKWNDQNNELYTGDNTGKISVLFITNFITKSMFQTPCATLMQLDSQIVQVDSCCNFLLVSTLTRCYLCDTEKEQYRQIGKKLRDGEFGACFFGVNNFSISAIQKQPQIGSFRVLGDKETFNACVELKNLRIYCARPGTRLWEVEIDGTVIRTHLFKQALTMNPSNVISIMGEDSRLEILTKDRSTNENSSFNFIKMYILNGQFILTFKKDGLYILDPQNAKVIAWTNIYSDIVDVKIIKNFIYLWTHKSRISILLFSSLETFLVKCLLNKKYLLCTDLCISYEKQLKKLITSSKKLHLLITLDEKLAERNATVLRDTIAPILDDIKKYSDERQSAQRLNSGIFIIDNAHFINNTIIQNEGKKYENNPSELPIETKNNLVTDLQMQTSVKFDVKQESSQTEKMPKSEVIHSDKIIDNKLDICRIYEQYELEKAIGHYNPKVITDILDDCSNFTEIFNIFIKLEQYGINLQTNETDIKIWCYDKCINYIYNRKSYTNIFDETDSYFVDAFITLNFSAENSCSCNFPFPKASNKTPKYYEIGTYIIENKYKNENEYLKICCDVPYMWKHVLKLQQNENINTLLPLIIQYSSEEILNLFLVKFTYDLWHDALKLFILLKSGKCLNCEKLFSDDGYGISWTNFATLMIKSIDAESSVGLLLQYSHDIPISALDVQFYQCSIFSSIVDNFQSNLRDKSIQFVQEINKSKCKPDFGKLLEKALQSPQLVSNTNFGKTAVTKSEENCGYCLMPLPTPVLSKEISILLKCGHTFHNICLKNQNGACNTCVNEPVMNLSTI